MQVDPISVPRRGFWPKLLAILAGAVATLMPAIAAVGFLFHPLRRRSASDRTAALASYLPLPIGPEALADDGTPQCFTVVADIVDAWNFYPGQPLGKIWLRKKTEDSTIVAFSTTCPHLGCDIDYRDAQNDFYCPCHASNFGLDGSRRNQIPPRSMDTLDTKIVDGKIFVKYQSFRGGVAAKEPE